MVPLGSGRPARHTRRLVGILHTLGFQVGTQTPYRAARLGLFPGYRNSLHLLRGGGARIPGRLRPQLID